jgi:uncharacterized protein YkwD
MRRAVLLTSLFLELACYRPVSPGGEASVQEVGCTKDTDCKGERICLQRECQAPPASEAPRRPKWQAAPLDANPGEAVSSGESFTPTGGAVASSVYPEAIEQKLLARINDLRVSKKLKPLASDERLLAAARGHSEEMAKLGYFSHSSPTAGRETFTDRLKLAGAAGVGYSGENIAFRESPLDDDAYAEALAAQWFESPMHRANILSPEYNVTGLGLYRAGARVWATQVFADRGGK